MKLQGTDIARSQLQRLSRRPVRFIDIAYALHKEAITKPPVMVSPTGTVDAYTQSEPLTKDKP